MKITILPSAKDDLAFGSAFYESQSVGLGKQFLEAVALDIDALRFSGGVHVKVFGFHRLLSKRFPYAIYYSVHSGTVSIRAILDCRRDTDLTTKRLQGFQQ